jgi:hypothetical protein
MILYSLKFKMDHSSLIIFGLVIIGFLPQIHLLSVLLITLVVELFYKLLRLVIDLLGIFVCLIIFCPVVLFLVIFLINILL